MIKKLLNYAWLKENLSMVILTPTIFGGIWQILSLGFIGTPYIRFFSVSQLVSDGLLLMFIFFWIFILFRMMYLATFGSDEKAPAEKIPDQANEPEVDEQANQTNSTITKGNNKGNWIFLILLLGIQTYLISLALPVFRGLQSKSTITLFEILGAHMAVLINMVCTLAIINYIIKIAKPKISVDKLIDFLTYPFGLLSIVAAFYILSYLPVLHRSFFKSEDFYNVKNLECSLKKEHANLKSYEMLYFNDKYIFVRIKNPAGQTFIQVKNFETFMEDCQ